jgi:ADP-ribose pyrophosphatase
MEELYSDKDWQVILESASLPDGREKHVSRVKRADSAHIIAFKDDDTILMLREYRPYYGTYIWMLPSGRVDKESDHITGAQRELQEETGFRAEKLDLMCKTNYSESLIATNYIYVASGLVKDPLPQDDDELIEVHECTLEEALENVLTSEVVHTPSAYALFFYRHQTTKKAE